MPKSGLAIAGDHEKALQARKLFDYYQDLVTEIELEARLDGSAQVGHTEPFGLFVDIRHTKEVEARVRRLFQISAESKQRRLLLQLWKAHGELSRRL